MEQRYADVARVLRRYKEHSTDFESRVTVDHITRDLCDIYMDQDPDFRIVEFNDAAGLYLPVLTGTEGH